MTTTSVSTEALVMRSTLNATDRCDRCGAQAYVVTNHGGAELLWCGHHFGENESKLQQYVVLDLRHNLNSEATV